MLELLNVWTVALAVLAVAAPAVGTVHVVLTKRKPHAAMAWVGVLWLAPLLGAAFYVLFGVNRTRRRARAIRMVEEVRDGTANLIACPGETLKELLGPDGGHLQPLATLGDRVAGRPLVAGNRVRMLRDGDQAYPAMLEAIAEAESTVTLITYIFDRDRAGRQFVDALAAAVDRGVEVRVLVDAVGARYSMPPITRSLHRAGIPTGRFHRVRIPRPTPYLNLRNHRKILVVDGRIGFTGGINIREGHVLGDNPSHPVRDLHFRSRGAGGHRAPGGVRRGLGGFHRGAASGP
jgi:cardiolipin synthase A/B